MGVWTTDKAVTIRQKVTPIVWQGDPRQPPTVQKFVGDGLDDNQAAAAAKQTRSGYDTTTPALGGVHDVQSASDLEEVIVTGDIRGVNPPGVKLLVISREDIDRHGYATVQEVMRVSRRTSVEVRARMPVTHRHTTCPRGRQSISEGSGRTPR